MLRRAGCLLTNALLQSAPTPTSSLAPALLRGFKAVADVEINFNDRETLKKYLGIRDHLSREPGTRGKFMEAISELMLALRALPEQCDYRKAVEATSAYRLKVCQQNESDAAVEEVLDAHMEELIQECREEVRLIPIIANNKPWDVPENYMVPVVDYQDASLILDAKK